MPKAILHYLKAASLPAVLLFASNPALAKMVDEKPAMSNPIILTTHTAPTASRDVAGTDSLMVDIIQDAAAASSPKYVAAASSLGYEWVMILEKYIKAPDDIGVARFNYGALAANPADRSALDSYIQELETTDVSALSNSEAIAFWANLYNAVTIKVVVDNYPVKSIRDIKSGWRAGPWKRDLVTVAGKKMSLDDIEHKTLRENYPSPLIHYMVNCASIGCPNLGAKPWTAGTLDAERDAAARIFINSPRGARVTDKGLKVSSIYKWFKEDFGGNDAGILAHLRKYAEPDLAKAIDGGAKIVDYGYIWSLNE